MTPIAIMIHHTAGNEKTAQQLRATFKERFGVDYIGYHYAIAPNGDVWKDLKDNQVGIHNNEGNINNMNSVSISFVGDFTNSQPTEAAWNKAKEIIRNIKKANPQVNQLVGHRDKKATACPGNKVYARLGELREALKTNTGGPAMDPLDTIIVPRDQVRIFYRHVRGTDPEPGADKDRPLRFLIDLLTEARNLGFQAGVQQGGGGPSPVTREVTLLELLQQTKVKII